MNKFILVGLLALTLSACSPEQLFEQLAKSDIEQSASESVNQSANYIKAYEDIVNAKKTEYDTSAKLTSVGGDASYGYVLKNDFDPAQGSAYYFMAILPPLEEAEAKYYGWLINPQNNAVINSGILTLNESDGYRSLTFTSPKDYSAYTSVLITQQTKVEAKPGTPILSGSF